VEGNRDFSIRRNHRLRVRTFREEDWAFIASFPPWLELPDHELLVVHAGLVAGVSLAEQREEHLLTMRSLAEERQTGTDVLLHTAPVSEAQIVLGKYLAAMGMLAILTLLTVYLPGLIFVNGKVSPSHIAVGYLGLLSLGSATVSIGIFGSSLFRSQLAAAMLSGVMVVSMLLFWMLSELTDPPFAEVLAYGALFDKHFIPFEKGRLVTSGLVYYATISFAFLSLSTRALEGRRWQ
jgi:ABC-2 type transport system permease protein